MVLALELTLPSTICSDIQRANIARLSWFSPVLNVVENLSDKLTWMCIFNAAHVLDGDPEDNSNVVLALELTPPSTVCSDIQRPDIARLSCFSPVIGVVEILSEKITWLCIFNAAHVLIEGDPNRLVEEPNTHKHHHHHQNRHHHHHRSNLGKIQLTLDSNVVLALELTLPSQICSDICRANMANIHVASWFYPVIGVIKDLSD